jgi:hypothetical protein
LEIEMSKAEKVSGWHKRAKRKAEAKGEWALSSSDKQTRVGFGDVDLASINETVTPGDPPMEFKTFLQWDRGGGEVARLMVQEYKGRLLVHLRIWSHGPGSKLYPTEHGLTIPYEQLTPLRTALRRVKDELHADANEVAS